jgi:hypothetical protein
MKIMHDPRNYFPRVHACTNRCHFVVSQRACRVIDPRKASGVSIDSVRWNSNDDISTTYQNHGLDDNRLAKIANNGKPDTCWRFPKLRKLDIDIMPT